MTKQDNQSDIGSVTKNRPIVGSKGSKRRRLSTAMLVLGAALLAVLVMAFWLGTRASIIRDELEATSQLVPVLKNDLASGNSEAAAATVGSIRMHTGAAREASHDPLWTLTSALPGIGPNFSAVAEVARSADDVAGLGLVPIVNVFDSLNWNAVLPSNSSTDLAPLRAASPSVVSAARAVRMSVERLDRIETSGLMPQVTEPLKQARDQLAAITGPLDAAADASALAPQMLGADGARNYLLMIQNNAETRASGGIPGALAVLTLDHGKLSLTAQSSAGEIGIMAPVIAVDPQQQQIYSGRLGKFMQDVNLTPDFPTAASTAQTMWEKKYGQRLDGVISLDPVALGYILDATGPVKMTNPELLNLAQSTLPTELNGSNVVKTLLSDVYSEIPRPQTQDAYFAGVAKEVFTALSSGKGDPKALIEGITRGSGEGRVLLWSANSDEQKIIANYALSGSISGPSVSPAQFGVYFNDGTGAKMDYYVKRTVQLVKECAKDGYEQTTVRITSTNTAPADAASSLPEYVTGGGIFGVPAGTVQTNIVSYGPSQANIETALIDGSKQFFATHTHATRPVGTVTVRLAPGQSSTVEITFGKIVQHTEPNLVVTPTVQPVKEVILNNESRECVASTKTSG